VDAEVVADDALVRLVGGRLADAVDGAELAPADTRRLVPQGLHLVAGQRTRQDGVAVAVVVVLGHGASVAGGAAVENVQQAREAIRS